MDESRRKFLKLSTLTVISASVLNSCEYDTLLSPDWSGRSVKIDLTDQVSDALYPPNNKPRLILKNVGAGFSKIFDGVNYNIPVIITRIKDENKEDDFSCFSSLCTHNNCSGIRPSLGKTGNSRHIVCPCHSSRFDAFNHGSVIQGPAEIPLKEFKTKFDISNNILEVFF